MNLQRFPLSGRNHELFSEDPVLTARMVVSYIRSAQEAGVSCCAKHFVANDQENDRMNASSDVDERTLREVYFVPFEAAVREAGVRTVMSGYNRVNGEYCPLNRWLLTTVLREDWGFEGCVVSDWFGNRGCEAVAAGLDLEMPGIEPRHYGPKLVDAVNDGEVEIAAVDAAVKR